MWLVKSEFRHLFSCRSLCEMEKETCGQKVVAVPSQHCRTTAQCNEVCGAERQFVCGSDNKFYRNECEMRRDNCGLVIEP
jgi:hypothetical protein